MLAFLLVLPTLLGFVGALVACLCERGEDPRFAGDKIIYRS